MQTTVIPCKKITDVRLATVHVGRLFVIAFVHHLFFFFPRSVFASNLLVHTPLHISGVASPLIHVQYKDTDTNMKDEWYKGIIGEAALAGQICLG